MVFAVSYTQIWRMNGESSGPEYHTELRSYFQATIFSFRKLSYQWIWHKGT